MNVTASSSTGALPRNGRDMANKIAAWPMSGYIFTIDRLAHALHRGGE